jgi:hypothetical protein
MFQLIGIHPLQVFVEVGKIGPAELGREEAQNSHQKPASLIALPSCYRSLIVSISALPRSLHQGTNVYIKYFVGLLSHASVNTQPGKGRTVI